MPQSPTGVLFAGDALFGGCLSMPGPLCFHRIQRVGAASRRGTAAPEQTAKARAAGLVR